MSMTDKERAEILGISLEAYYKLSPPDNSHLLENAEAGLDGMDRKFYDELGDANVIVKRGNPHSDTGKYDSKNIDIYWDHYPSTPEEQALFYGYHIHSKDNPYGLHTHMPGGKLSGAHGHGPQNRRGSHTHAIDSEDLPTDLLINPMSPLYIDGEHEHQENFPDGPHSHAPQTFG